MLPKTMLPTPENSNPTGGRQRSILSPVIVLAWTFFLVPALGVPGEWMVQDSLKSAVLAVGTVLAGLSFFWQKRHNTTPLLWHGVLWLPLVLMTYALGSMAWSHAFLAGVEAIRWFVLALVLWLLLNTVRKANLIRLLSAVHWGTFVAACWAALQFWGGWSIFPQGPQPASTFYNRNFFAEYAVCALPYSVYLLASLRQSAKPLWIAATLALNVTAILMTGTRSALLALLVVVPTLSVVLLVYRAQFHFYVWNRRTQNTILLTVFAGIVGLGCIPTGNADITKEGFGATALQRSFVRTASATSSEGYATGTFSVRTQMWQATARMLMAHPLTGVGAGAWEVEVPLYQRNDTVLETDFYAHNEILQLLSEYGLVFGGLVTAFLLAYWLYAVSRTVQQKYTAPSQVPERTIALIALAALFIVSNAGFPLHLAGGGALLALALGILAASDAHAGWRERLLASTISWRAHYGKSALLVLAVCLGVALRIIQLAARAEYSTVQAARLASQWIQTSASDVISKSNLKAQLQHHLRESFAINPDERKFSVSTADVLGAGGDLEDATWILETVAKSRPHVTSIWYALAMNYALTGRHALAQQALKQVQRLKPGAWATLTLEVTLLNARDPQRAAEKLNTLLAQGIFDRRVLELGYSIGKQTRQWDLAIRALELMQTQWPELNADTYLKLGNLYAEPAVGNPVKALQAFKSGLAALPAAAQEDYRASVPLPYREQL